jgi:hypothetical protein
MQLETLRHLGGRYLPLMGAALALVALAGCRPEQKAAAPDIRPVRYMKVEMFPGGETVSLTRLNPKSTSRFVSMAGSWSVGSTSERRSRLAS